MQSPKVTATRTGSLTVTVPESQAESDSDSEAESRADFRSMLPRRRLKMQAWSRLSPKHVSGGGFYKRTPES
eukprot:1443652-Rhodomonas_salina.1